MADVWHAVEFLALLFLVAAIMSVAVDNME